MSLEVQNITKSYSGTRVLQNISLTLEPGALVVLIGPSGGGKSTLVRHMAFLETPDEGRVVLDGEAYYQNHPDSKMKVWPKVTVVFQQHFLWPHLTLGENVALPGSRKEGFTDIAESLVALFGMAKFMDRYPNQVSLGQRQRAALIRALVLQPRYLLLDEITSALDVEQTATILSILLDHKGIEFGLLLVTHHLGFATRLARSHQNSRIVFLADGKIVEQIKPDSLHAPKSEQLRCFLEAERLLHEYPSCR